MTWRAIVAGVVLFCGLPGMSVGGERKAKTFPPPDFYPATIALVSHKPDSIGNQFPYYQGTVVESTNPSDAESIPPECTPYRTTVDTTMEEVKFKDPNDAWPAFYMDLVAWKKLVKFSSMKECLDSLPKYQGRASEEQIQDLEKGRLTAGMPYEFALMLLGEPQGPPSYLNVMNPVTKRPEEFWSYSWVKDSNATSAAAVFGFLGAGMLGLAAGTSTYGEMSRYLRIASVTQVAEVVAWQTALKQARFVSVQVSPDQSIHAVIA